MEELKKPLCDRLSNKGPVNVNFYTLTITYVILNGVQIYLNTIFSNNNWSPLRLLICSVLMILNSTVWLNFPDKCKGQNRIQLILASLFLIASTPTGFERGQIVPVAFVLHHFGFFLLQFLFLTVP